MNTVKEMKRQVTDLEKIFVIHISDKQLESRKLKQLLKLNDNSTNIPNKNWERNFITKNIEMDNKHMKKILNIISHQGNAN